MEVNSNVAAAASAADLVLSSGVQQYTPTQDSSERSSSESTSTSQSDSSDKSSKLSKEEAEKAAKDLEKALNRPADTEIKFNVKLISAGEEGGVTDFKFQVVEKGTGKVVRQFPPEDINGIKERARTTPAIPGIFINSIA